MQAMDVKANMRFIKTGRQSKSKANQAKVKYPNQAKVKTLGKQVF